MANSVCYETANTIVQPCKGFDGKLLLVHFIVLAIN